VYEAKEEERNMSAVNYAHVEKPVSETQVEGSLHSNPKSQLAHFRLD